VSISEQTVAARQILDFLETGHDATGETGELKASLDRLSQVSGEDYSDVYRSIRTVYSSLLDLRDDLETLRQLAALDDDFQEIVGARAYIASVQVPSVGFPNLALDQETLIAGL
jgi:hypothetical protein